MTITLKDIAESEKICEATTKGPWSIEEEEADMGDWIATRDIPELNIKIGGSRWRKVVNSLEIKEEDAQFIIHARTQLPAMNKLVREMYRELKFVALRGCVSPGEPKCVCLFCRARRLVERLEG